jgi:hypothetical protein
MHVLLLFGLEVLVLLALAVAARLTRGRADMRVTRRL